MHGNRISDLNEVDKLQTLKNLNALTLHGNPIENLPGFRHYVLAKLPNLKHLNFCGVSNAERTTAKVLVKTNKMILIATSNTQSKTNENKDKKSKNDED
jgi:hypothetical protein